MSAIFNFDFWHNLFVHLKYATVCSKPHLNQACGCRDTNTSLKFKHNVKHKNIPNMRLIPLDHVPGRGGGILMYQSDIQVPPSTSDIGVFW